MSEPEQVEQEKYCQHNNHGHEFIWYMIFMLFNISILDCGTDSRQNSNIQEIEYKIRNLENK